MRKYCLHILCLIALALPGMAGAQDLPSLGKASEITVGALPNGISYYIAANPAEKGFADFSLVQKGIPDVDSARDNLMHIPNFSDRKPYEFVAAHGSSPLARGYVSYGESSTVFRFPDMPVYDQAVVDSTLMMLFNMASSSKWEQAVVICGDVAAAAITDRMKSFSLLLETREKGAPQAEYNWQPTDTVTLRTLGTDAGKVAAINVIFRAERVAKNNLNTVLPLVTRMYSEELGIVLEERLQAAFAQASIPLLDTRFIYADSAVSPSDEHYRLSVFTAADRLEDAVETLAGVLSSLDSNGVEAPEFNYAVGSLALAKKAELSGIKPNSEYTDKCISAYLYGSNLASDATILDFVSRQVAQGETALPLFNSFVSALLDSSRNLSIRYDLPRGSGRDGLAEKFAEGWSKPLAGRFSAGSPENLRSGSNKLRLRKESAEPITGGKLLQFSNGMEVVYKKMDGIKDISYAVCLRGGYPSVPGLKRGEGVFVGDMLPLCRIAGMSAEEFRAMLQSEGISMQTQVGLSDLRVCGTAPQDKLPLLLSSLLSLSQDREPEAAAFQAYRLRESFRKDMAAMSPRDVNPLMDAIMSPDYVFLENRDYSNLGTDLQARAEQYFTERFSNFSDGVIVLLGNLDEDKLKKELLKILGDFKTGNVHASKPVVEYPLYSGRRTEKAQATIGIVGPEEVGVNMKLGFFLDFSMTNRMSFDAALRVLRREIAPVLAKNGYSAEIKGRMDLFPKEACYVYINASPCFQNGVPQGMLPSEPSVVLEDLRAMLSNLPSARISAADLKAYKTLLQEEMKAKEKSPEDLADFLLTRYSQSKNTFSNYASAINSISAQSIKDVLSAMKGGAIVEYVIE